MILSGAKSQGLPLVSIQISAWPRDTIMASRHPPMLRTAQKGSIQASSRPPNGWRAAEFRLSKHSTASATLPAMESLHALAVDEGAAAARSGEQFAQRGHVGESGHHFAVGFQADQVGPGRIAAHEIAGAVDGVDDPAAAAARGFLRALLAEQAVVREGALQFAGDELFAFAVGAGDGRVVGFGFEGDARAVIAHGDFAGLARDGAAGGEFFFEVLHGSHQGSIRRGPQTARALLLTF